MPISKLRPSFTLTEDRLRELQDIVPEAFADGRINWDTLREALGEHLEDETKEHFGLFWPGKREARRLAALPSKGTLIPQPGAGVDEDSTHNLFIEGDNLEVLKLLQKSYAGRVKMIFIDPPYNTGHDFVYPDDYSEPLEAYLERTGQVDETGQVLTTNTRASGRFHSNWLNMIYPRLLLARQLLKDDGVIFITIDNTEVQNLRLILDEIFGQENFVDCIVWQKKVSPSNDATWFSSDHDYILVYAKQKDIWRPNRLAMNERQKGYYQNPDNDPRGDWNSSTYTCNKTKDERPNLYYPIINPNTGEKILPKETAVWAYSKELHQEHLAQNLIYWGKDGKAKPRLKIFLSEAGKVVPRSVWLYDDVGHTQEATRELQKLFPQGGFDTPKPPRLLRRILEITTNSNTNDLVLDFFAGSSTTAQAVIEQNQSDDGNRQFIMIQLPEPTPEKSTARQTGYKTISEFSKERIRRVLSAVTKEKKKQLALGNNLDLGFKCLDLQASNFKEWEHFSGKDTSQLELRFGQAETPLVEGWTSENLLTEILLLQGFPLDSSVKALPEFKTNEVKQITSEFVGHHLYVCLDKKIKAETVAKLSLRNEDILVCLDSALSDEAKVNLADQCNLKVI